jgi:hypothetical protein
MKNFSEATVIKPNLTLKMVFDLEAIGICPCQIKINEQLEFYGDLVGKNTFIKHLPLTDPINISITTRERQHPQAIEIVGLKIDDHEIIPLYLNQSNPPTNYLDFTGVWILTIPNFYSWYHELTGQGWIA